MAYDVRPTQVLGYEPLLLRFLDSPAAKHFILLFIRREVVPKKFCGALSNLRAPQEEI